MASSEGGLESGSLRRPRTTHEDAPDRPSTAFPRDRRAYEKEIVNRDMTIMDLTAENAALQGQIARLEQSHKAELQKAEQKQEDTAGVLEDQLRKVADLQAQRDSLQSDYNALKLGNSDLSGSLLDEQLQCLNLQARVTTAEEAIRKLEEDQSGLRGEVSEWKQKCVSLESKMISVEKQKEMVTSEHAMLWKKYANRGLELERMKLDFQATHAEREAEMEQWKTELEKTKYDLSTLETHSNGLTKDYVRLQNELEDVQEAYTELQTKYSVLQEDREVLGNSHQELYLQASRQAGHHHRTQQTLKVMVNDAMATAAERDGLVRVKEKEVSKLKVQVQALLHDMQEVKAAKETSARDVESMVHEDENNKGKAGLLLALCAVLMMLFAGSI